MAQKRMFDKSITNSDNFLELPDSSQILYFHLSMNADDDGFIDNWKSIMRMTGTKEDDLKILITKSYVIPFDTGVIVIRHWRMNNYLRNDRYKETTHKEEKKLLSLGENEEYILATNNIGIPMVDTDKNSIEENSKENNKEINKERKENIESVVRYLNLTLDTRYKATSQNIVKHINARFEEGYTLDDFFDVIEGKYEEWKGTEMEKYLRPDTLFGTKFDIYLNQIQCKKKN